MNSQIYIRSLLLSTLLIVLCAGCGSGRPKSNRPATVLASGVLTYRGAPVNEAVIVFQPSDPKAVAASAVTDQNGKFDLKAFPPDSGAVPGTYQVMIMKISQEDAHPEGGDRTKAIVPTSLIPVRYSNPAKSGLSAEVPQVGTDQLLFELKD